MSELPQKGQWISSIHIVVYVVIQNGKVVNFVQTKEDGSFEQPSLGIYDTTIYPSISDIKNPVEEKVYFVSNKYYSFDYYYYYNGNWSLLVKPQGELIVTNNGVTDCAGYATVNVQSALVKQIINGSVTKIEKSDLDGDLRDYAFAGCKKLTEIELPTNCNSIGSYAFYNCTSLTTVRITYDTSYDDVLQFWVNDYSFANCTSLTSIIFNGTKERWYELLERNSTNMRGWNENTGNYTIYCTDGTILKNGTET